MNTIPINITSQRSTLSAYGWRKHKSNLGRMHQCPRNDIVVAAMRNIRDSSIAFVTFSLE